MKSRAAIALWCSGLVVAGSAVAFVNTAVLSDEPNRGALVAEIADVSVSTLAVGTSVTVAPGAEGSYDLGDAGTVSVETTNGVVTIGSIAPSPGWTVVSIASLSPTRVVVTLESATQRVQFTAALVAGVLATSLAEVADGTVTPVTQTTSDSGVVRPPTSSVPGPTTSSPRPPTSVDDDPDEPDDSVPDDDTDDSVDDDSVDDDSVDDD